MSFVTRLKNDLQLSSESKPCPFLEEKLSFIQAPLENLLKTVNKILDQEFRLLTSIISSSDDLEDFELP